MMSWGVCWAGDPPVAGRPAAPECGGVPGGAGAPPPAGGAAGGRGPARRGAPGPRPGRPAALGRRARGAGLQALRLGLGQTHHLVTTTTPHQDRPADGATAPDLIMTTGHDVS